MYIFYSKYKMEKKIIKYRDYVKRSFESKKSGWYRVLTCPFASCHQVAIAATIGSVATISGHDFPTRSIPFYPSPRRVYSPPSVRQSENYYSCIYLGRKNTLDFTNIEVKRMVECCAKWWSRLLKIEVKRKVGRIIFRILRFY